VFAREKVYYRVCRTEGEPEGRDGKLARETHKKSVRLGPLLVLAAVLIGGFRVHLLGLGRADQAKLVSYKISKNLEGFIYRAPWNKEGKLLFVSGSMKVLVDAAQLEAEEQEKLGRGEFVRLEKYYIYHCSEPTNPGVFNYRRYLLSRGVEYMLRLFPDGYTVTAPSSKNLFPGVFSWPGARARSYIRQVLEQGIGGTQGELVLAVMTGDTGTLDENVQERFRAGGLSHLMAVSGMHVTFVLLPFRMLGKNRKLDFKKRNLLLLAPVTAFMGLADFSSSVVRGGIGAVFRMIAAATARPYDARSALCVSAALQILLNPYVIFNSGFLLSYGAVISLLFIEPNLSRMLKKEPKEKHGVKRIRPVDLSALRAGLSVNLGVMPLMAYMFGSISPIGLIATLYASVLAAAVCVCGYAFSLCQLLRGIYILRPAAFLLKNGLRAFAWLMDRIAWLGEKLPAPLGRIKIPAFSIWILVLIYLVIFLIFVPKTEGIGLKIKTCWLGAVRSKAGKAAIACIGAAVLAAGGYTYAVRPEIEALVIDVGQGSAMLVKADGYTGLIDTGDGDTDVSRVAEAAGVAKLDFLVLTHGHLDHTGGLQSVLEAFPPGMLYISSDTSGALLKAEYAALDANWRVTAVETGDRVRLGDVQMEFLCADKFFGGRTDADENNASLCVRFSCGYGSLIVTGDLQQEGEEALCEAGAFKETDVLIVPHHGSASGSGEKMLSIMKPGYAIISVGVKNTYGHPSNDALSRLEAAGARIFRTDTGGGIRIRIGKTSLLRRNTVNIRQTV